MGERDTVPNSPFIEAVRASHRQLETLMASEAPSARDLNDAVERFCDLAGPASNIESIVAERVPGWTFESSAAWRMMYPVYNTPMVFTYRSGKGERVVFDIKDRFDYATAVFHTLRDIQTEQRHLLTHGQEGAVADILDRVDAKYAALQPGASPHMSVLPMAEAREGMVLLLSAELDWLDFEAVPVTRPSYTPLSTPAPAVPRP